MTVLANATRRLLHEVGYSDDLVIDEYRVWTGGRNIVRLDGAAFAAVPTDMTTATIVISQLNGHGNTRTDQLREAAAALAAPIAIEASRDSLRIYSVDHEQGLTMVEEVSLLDLVDYQRLSWQIGPRPLLEAKWGSRQLTLFPTDINLLRSARSKVRNELTHRIETAFNAIAEVLDESETDDRVSKLRSSRLIVGALTSAFVRDKNGLDDVAATELPILARQRYQSYFTWLDERPEENDLLVQAIDELSDGISYRGLSPDIVSEVYGTVLVNAMERKALGIHYTPPEIASRLLDALPIEELPPEDRQIFDPTCGSGTLLIAGYDRLRALDLDLDRRLPPSISAVDTQQWHQRLTSQLYGSDRDPFAVQITKLALLLHDETGGNGWNITEQDSLSGHGFAPNATILVANPPWLLSKGEERTERANTFVASLLDRLPTNGLLGLILPASWLTADRSAAMRNRVIQECDVFEIWRLPEQVFRSSRSAPTMICARKRSVTGRNWRVFRRVFASPERLDRFYDTGVADETLLMESNSTLVTGTLTQCLARQGELLSLGRYVDVRVGAQPRKGIVDQPAGSHKFLPGTKKLCEFGPPPADALISVNFPEDFYRNTPVEIAASPKVIVSATRWTDNPWRLKVGIDAEGIIVRNSLQVILVRPDSPIDRDSMLYAIMALLGSGLASLWIDEHATKRSPSEQNYLSIPVPADLDWSQLAQIGRRLHQVYSDPAELYEATAALETFIWASYKIPSTIVRSLIERLIIKQPPEGGGRYDDAFKDASKLQPPDRLQKGEVRIGGVLEIEADGLVVWVNSVTSTEGQKIALPNRFPGSLLHEEATFETDATSASELSRGGYWLQREEWRTDDELDDYLSTWQT